MGRSETTEMTLSSVVRGKMFKSCLLKPVGWGTRYLTRKGLPDLARLGEICRQNNVGV